MKLILNLLSLIAFLFLTTTNANSQNSFLPNNEVKVIKNSDTLMLPWACPR